MLPHRKVILAVCLLITVGSITTTVAYALRLHSEGYRRQLQKEVSEWIGMEVSIGRVRPESWDRRGFEEVAAFLPETGQQIFACRSALWSEKANGDPASCVLELRDGWLLVGTNEWTGSDYRRILKGGLGHDYLALGLAQVRLEDISLRFIHPSLEFRAGVTSGLIIFDEAGDGQASLNCTRLNGVEVADPVNIASRFTPGSSLMFHEVRLTVPEMPLASLGLDDLLGGSPSSGSFEGTITYVPTNQCKQINVTGSIRNAQLAELTRMVRGGPYHGAVDIELDSAVFGDGVLQSLELRGRLDGLRIGEIIPDLAGDGAAAELTLQIERLSWVQERIEYFSARGHCANVSLEALSQLLGGGRITGSGRLVIRSLLIVDEELRFADIDLIVEPPDDRPGTMDRTLLVQLAQMLLGLDLSALLPEEVEYTQLGVNLVVDRGLLKIYGTHGPEGKTILTLKVGGLALGVVDQPEQTFDVSSLLGQAKGYVTGLDLAAIRRWWRLQHAAEEKGSG